MVKFKKSALKNIFLILFVVGLLFVTGSIAIQTDEKAKIDTVKKDSFNKVSANNSMFSLLWDFDTIGYGHDGAYYLKTSELKSLDKDRSVYLIFASPFEFNNGSQITVSSLEKYNETTKKEYFCNSGLYGWHDESKNVVFCNHSVSVYSNVTMQNETLYYLETSEITKDNYWVGTENNLTIYYNITEKIEKPIETIFSPHVKKFKEAEKKSFNNKFNKDFSDFGSNWLFIDNSIFLEKDRPVSVKFRIEVEKQYVPMKYSIIIVDVGTGEYLVLDPTIINARTWSTNADFTNGTILTNLSSSDTGVSLSSSSSVYATNVSTHFNMSDAKDYLGNITLTNSGVTFGAGGKVDNMATFNNGANNQRMYTGADALDYFYTTDASVNLRIYGDDFTSPYVEGLDIISGAPGEGAVCSGNNDWYLGLDDTSNKLMFTPWGSGYNEMRMGFPLNISTWYMITVTHNETGTDEWRLYLNGILYNSTSAENTQTCSNTRYELGNRPHATTYIHPFHGKMDEMTFWNGYTLTQEDITNLYNSGSGKGYPFSSLQSQGLYQDLQGWTPQTNKRINNITIVYNNQSTGTLQFRYNITNSSVPTSSYVNIPNGTTTINLDTSADQTIYYDFLLQTGGTLVSYTIGEVAVQTPTPTQDLLNISQNNQSVYLNSSSGCHETCLLYQDAVNVVNFTSFPYNRTGLTNNTQYAFKFAVYNSSYTIQLSNFSNTVTTTTSQNSAPPPPAGDTCTYTTGNWNVNCQDYCMINTTVNTLPNKIIFNGTGEFRVNATITTNFTTLQTIKIINSSFTDEETASYCSDVSVTCGIITNINTCARSCGTPSCNSAVDENQTSYWYDGNDGSVGQGARKIYENVTLPNSSQSPFWFYTIGACSGTMLSQINVSCYNYLNSDWVVLGTTNIQNGNIPLNTKKNVSIPQNCYSTNTLQILTDFFINGGVSTYAFHYYEGYVNYTTNINSCKLAVFTDKNGQMVFNK